MVDLIRANAELRQQISRRVRAEQVLLETKRRLRRLLAFSPIVIYSSQPSGDYGITFVSESIFKLGYEPQQFLENSWFWQQCVHPDDLQQVLAELSRLNEQGQRLFEYRFLHQAGHYCWIQDQRKLIRDETGNPIETIGSWQDITERKQMEQALFQEKELAQITLESIGDAVITTDAAGLIEYLNPMAEQITGWRATQAKGMPLAEVFKTLNETTRQPGENLIERVRSSGRVMGLAYPTLLVARDGTEYAIDNSAAPICDRESRMIGTVIVFRDVTQHHFLARKLAWQAGHDSLTGLVNRRGFEQRLTEAIASAQEPGQQHMLCYLDLDQFKVVNDTCGHMAGDELLRQLAARLQNLVRASDLLARLGGDEFGVILHQCPLEAAKHVANNIQETIRDFPFVWEDKTFAIRASIGLVAITSDSGDLNSVLSAADSACYAAKDSGRDRIHVYQADDRELAQQRGERQWVTRILKALDENRLCLYHQAIVPIVDPTLPSPPAMPMMGHSEILLRMISETGELVPPMAFIPAAERYGLMPALDRWVIRTFFASYSRHVQEHLPPVTPHLYTINLSGASINDEQFLPFLKEQLELHQVSPQTICFEITETAAITNLSRAAQLINELKALGCYFALDDFGSGMSSFAYLKNLPVDYLKIDGNFVKDIVSDPIDSAMVDCINRIGHVIGIRTIAEFVENEVILAKLLELGVDFAQGYGISQPRALRL
ncbi:MAG: EAL domain-containing protein [Pegethrix bostrychoides GSE-TBD4-15B]|uniref:EAL domain-containing protein n=1 Tax=Pegethrix bostrychoides GSE-TBD4-15B TaxID=2839662 RepID=A0A951U5F5_9CYAN|nr:EAL domain-containing protein [Pegethrix bostrychoides GSE-TBD4-15B]